MRKLVFAIVGLGSVAFLLGTTGGAQAEYPCNSNFTLQGGVCVPYRGPCTRYGYGYRRYGYDRYGYAPYGRSYRHYYHSVGSYQGTCLLNKIS